MDRLIYRRNVRLFVASTGFDLLIEVVPLLDRLTDGSAHLSTNFRLVNQSTDGSARLEKSHLLSKTTKKLVGQLITLHLSLISFYLITFDKWHILYSQPISV